MSLASKGCSSRCLTRTEVDFPIGGVACSSAGSKLDQGNDEQNQSQDLHQCPDPEQNSARRNHKQEYSNGLSQSQSERATVPGDVYPGAWFKLFVLCLSQPSGLYSLLSTPRQEEH